MIEEPTSFGRWRKGILSFEKRTSGEMPRSGENLLQTFVDHTGWARVAPRAFLTLKVAAQRLFKIESLLIQCDSQRDMFLTQFSIGVYSIQLNPGSGAPIPVEYFRRTPGLIDLSGIITGEIGQSISITIENRSEVVRVAFALLVGLYAE